MKLKTMIAISILFSAQLLNAETALVRFYFDASHQPDDLQALGYESAMCRLPHDYGDYFVPTEQLGRRELADWSMEIRQSDMDAYISRAVSQRGDLGQYHTFQEVEDELRAIHTAFPDITLLQSIGKTWQNRDIWAMKISDNAAVDEDEPELLIIGVHHSREIITAEIPLDFIKFLTENYAVNDTSAFIVNQREVWVVPMLNPDGHNVVATTYNYWRKNVRDNNASGIFDLQYDGVDLNRNYGYNWGYNNVGSNPNMSAETYRGPAAFSEPENQAIRNFARNRKFVIAINYHSYGRLVLYPWGYAAQNTPDHATFVKLGQAFVAENGYVQGNVTSGTIYETNGDSDDWFYGDQITKNKILSFTPEVGTEFLPSESAIPQLLADTRPINIKAALFSSNPGGVDPPGQPDRPEAIFDSWNRFHLSWTTPRPDPANPAVSYEVRELYNAQQITDSAEGNIPWLYQGFVPSLARAFSNQKSYYSGRSSRADSRLTAIRPIFVEAGAHLTFKTWYETESAYDYAYVSISTDGLNFTNIPGNITTTQDPNRKNLGHGITGASDGWIEGDFDLSAYAGQALFIRFRYVTDDRVEGEGFYFDDIKPVMQFERDEIIAKNLIASSYSTPDRPNGHYYYQARGRDAEFQPSLWSPYLPVVIEQPVAVEPGTDARFNALGQNYPNPFNPATMLSFALQNSGHVKLQIYDASGRWVRTLLDEQRPAGWQEIYWDGRSNSDTVVASGLYFYELQTADGFTARKSMILMK